MRLRSSLNFWPGFGAAACLVLCACSGATPESSSDGTARGQPEGEVFGLQRQDALRRLDAQESGIFDPQSSCDGELPCVATRFRGCCADYFDGDCGWSAVNQVWLERSIAQCAEEECAEGASPCLQRSIGDAPEAYCAVYERSDSVFAMCRLRERN